MTYFAAIVFFFLVVVVVLGNKPGSSPISGKYSAIEFYPRPVFFPCLEDLFLIM